MVLNIFKRQKSKVIAFLLNESIKVFEEEKIVLIKIDSTVEGNLARGKVGMKQLNNIDEELAAIKKFRRLYNCCNAASSSVSNYP